MQTTTPRSNAFARRLLPVFAVLLLLPVVAQADSWALWDWSATINGTTYNPPPLPGSVNSAGFDFATGLGSLTFTFNTPGSHYGGVYLSQYYDHGDGFDHSTAYGGVSGVAPAGLTWEMDWPGFLKPTAPPTVFDDFALNALTNTNNVPAYSAPPNACCTIAMAMIRSFLLGAGESASLTFTVGTAVPGGFYLQEADHDAGASVYLSEKLNITGGGGPTVPEPSAILLLLTTCTGVFCVMRRSRT